MTSGMHGLMRIFHYIIKVHVCVLHRFGALHKQCVLGSPFPREPGYEATLFIDPPFFRFIIVHFPFQIFTNSVSTPEFRNFSVHLLDISILESNLSS